MTLSKAFFDTLQSFQKICDEYLSSFKGKKRRNTIEGAFGSHIIKQVKYDLERIQSWQCPKLSKVQDTLRGCYKRLMILASELALYHKTFWHDAVRKLAVSIANLLPDEVYQLSFFDDADYTDSRITEKPTFRCFQKWLSRWKDSQFANWLARQAMPAVEQTRANHKRFIQMNLPLVIR